METVFSECIFLFFDSCPSPCLQLVTLININSKNVEVFRKLRTVKDPNHLPEFSQHLLRGHEISIWMWIWISYCLFFKTRSCHSTETETETELQWTLVTLNSSTAQTHYSFFFMHYLIPTAFPLWHLSCFILIHSF